MKGSTHTFIALLIFSVIFLIIALNSVTIIKTKIEMTIGPVYQFLTTMSLYFDILSTLSGKTLLILPFNKTSSCSLVYPKGLFPNETPYLFSSGELDFTKYKLIVEAPYMKDFVEKLIIINCTEKYIYECAIDFLTRENISNVIKAICGDACFVELECNYRTNICKVFARVNRARIFVFSVKFLGGKQPLIKCGEFYLYNLGVDVEDVGNNVNFFFFLNAKKSLGNVVSFSDNDINFFIERKIAIGNSEIQLRIRMNDPLITKDENTYLLEVQSFSLSKGKLATTPIWYLSEGIYTFVPLDLYLQRFFDISARELYYCNFTERKCIFWEIRSPSIIFSVKNTYEKSTNLFFVRADPVNLFFKKLAEAISSMKPIHAEIIIPLSGVINYTEVIEEYNPPLFEFAGIKIPNPFYKERRVIVVPKLEKRVLFEYDEKNNILYINTITKKYPVNISDIERKNSVAIMVSVINKSRQELLVFSFNLYKSIYDAVTISKVMVNSFVGLDNTCRFFLESKSEELSKKYAENLREFSRTLLLDYNRVVSELNTQKDELDRLYNEGVLPSETYNEIRSHLDMLIENFTYLHKKLSEIISRLREETTSNEYRSEYSYIYIYDLAEVECPLLVGLYEENYQEIVGYYENITSNYQQILSQISPYLSGQRIVIYGNMNFVRIYIE